jgi:ATP-binding cassette, subfamily B (MDR/TAP), member 1
LFFWGFLWDVYQTVPSKALVAISLNGAITPVFSLLLSRLIFEVSVGGRATSLDGYETHSGHF